MPYPSHLTHEEIERHAFLAGDGLITSLAEAAHDLEQENLTLNNNQEALRISSFEAGKLEGLGEDIQATITNLNAQVNDLQARLGKATKLLGTCHAWLQGDQSKTVKGRRDAARSLAVNMSLTGLGHPSHPPH